MKFNFNPFRKGLNQVLGKLEEDIMNVLWEKGESSVKEILESFPKERIVSYSAVITVTNRMTKKGLLRKRKEKKAFLYKPSYNKEQFYEIVSKAVVEGISGLSLRSAMVNFVEYMSQLNPDKIEYFSQLIESKKQSLNTERTNEK
ncbi:MAG: BlaI/MecI/CopY family transcriptional regulator [Candidatus Kuenenia sp.]|nr:BlaI/MecI/CopY family transcriptional regulator [Candidatus Kuenenia hertensis]